MEGVIPRHSGADKKGVGKSQYVWGNQDEVRVLNARHLAQLLYCLDMVGDFGEVHLIVREGELRFMRVLMSYKVEAEL